MFTIADIYNIAVQIERNGEAEYRKAAQQTTNAMLKKLYLDMADQEAEHALWFAELTAKAPEQHIDSEDLGEFGAKMLQDIVKDAKFPADGKELDTIATPQEAVQFFIALEEDTIDFYQFISSLLEDEETQKELQQIIEEEKQHSKKLKEGGI